MLHRKTLTLALSAALIAAPALAQAHWQWLVPSSTVLSNPAWITVDAASSNDPFHFNHAALRGIDETLQIQAPDGSLLEPENLIQGQLRSVFDVQIEQSGTHRVAVVSDGLMASWRDGGIPRRFRGSAADLDAAIPEGATDVQIGEGISRIETFVTVGAPTELEPVGEGLELVPVSHVNDLYVGEETTFRFDIDGQPAADLDVLIIRSGVRNRDQNEEQELTTDSAGEIRMTWEEPGMYWIHANTSDDQTRSPRAEQRRLNYSATLEVLPL